MYIGLYGSSSVQRIMDFVKTVYNFGEATPVIIKPIGAAAQIGVPEAYKLSYKLGKPLIVLPSINDLVEIFKPSKTYYITGKGVPIDPAELSTDTAIVLPGGEMEPSRDEIVDVEKASIIGVPPGLPGSVLAGIILYRRCSKA